MRILINSCIRAVDRIGVRERRKPCAVRLQEDGSHTVSQIIAIFVMIIVVEESNRCNSSNKKEA